MATFARKCFDVGKNDNAIAALGWARRERWLGKAERQYGRGS